MKSHNEAIHPWAKIHRSKDSYRKIKRNQEDPSVEKIPSELILNRQQEIKRRGTKLQSPFGTSRKCHNSGNSLFLQFARKPKHVKVINVCRNQFVAQYITYLNIWWVLSRNVSSLSTHDQLIIPIIYRTLLLQNSLKVIIIVSLWGFLKYAFGKNVTKNRLFNRRVPVLF